MKPNFDFQEKFGHIVNFMPDGGLVYEQATTGKLFSIPDNMNETTLELLMKKSVSENKDFVFDFVKNNAFKLKEAVDY